MSPVNSEQSWPLPWAKPEEVGFSPERLARIGPSMQRFIDQQKVPHLVTIVARHGKTVHFDARGFMDLDSKNPIHKDAIFQLYSNTKPITGVAVMMLCEAGLLNLDDPISRYIPTFKDPVVIVPELPERPEAGLPNPLPPIFTVPARREITIRDCLRHTTGMATPGRISAQYMAANRETMTKLGWYPGATPATTTRELVETLAKLPLVFHPGTDWEYHVGYPVLGVVIETVTRKTLEEFYQESIFRPLGMRDSSFRLAEKAFNRLPSCYLPRFTREGPALAADDRPETYRKAKDDKANSDAGTGVLSTVGDYARFGQMLLNGGELDGVRILGRKTVQLMTRNHLGNLYDRLLGPGFGWGLGVVVYDGSGGAPLLRSPGTYSCTGAAGTFYFTDPKEDLLCVCFTQVLNHRVIPGCTFQEEFERLVYQALI